jgi:hypothetical protein
MAPALLSAPFTGLDSPLDGRINGQTDLMADGPSLAPLGARCAELLAGDSRAEAARRRGAETAALRRRLRALLDATPDGDIQEQALAAAAALPARSRPCDREAAMEAARAALEEIVARLPGGEAAGDGCGTEKWQAWRTSSADTNLIQHQKAWHWRAACRERRQRRERWREAWDGR